MYEKDKKNMWESIIKIIGIIGGVLGVINTILIIKDRCLVLKVVILSHGNESKDCGIVTFKIINHSKRSVGIRSIRLIGTQKNILSDKPDLEQMVLPCELNSERRLNGKFNCNQ